ncbi:MAG: PEP-CTERM sorting domain-containing protein [Bryobacteraceae bacterium]|jgi:hypothetical protein
MNSKTFRFLKQVFPSSVAAVTLLGLVAIANPARADSLCPNAALPGGFGGTATAVSGPLDGTCGANSAVQLQISTETDYGKLQFNSGMTGYPAGLTLGNLASLTADVLFSGHPGDQPYYLLDFTDSSDTLGQANATDQILLIEFQPSTLSGDTLAVDPNATLFNLYDNTNGNYLEGGQSDTNTLAGWLSSDPSLSGESLQGVWLGIGLASGGGNSESLTVNSLDIEGGPASVPEPTSLLLLLTVVGAIGLGIQRKQARNRRS